MPKLVNTNPTPARVMKPKANGDEGTLQRIRPGQVVSAEGAYADSLAATPGFETATSEDIERWDAELERGRTKSALPGDGSRLSQKLALGPARQALRMQTTVAPLQRVIGDDAAPQGPPSGTITTRGEAATSGEPGDLRAFAQGEELVAQGVKIPAPGASEQDVLAGRATGADIHNAQVDNMRAAEAAAKEHIATATGEPVSGDYDGETMHALEQEVERRRSEGRDVEVTPTGKQGGVKKSDLVDALNADDEKGA